jgi:hypothetical protein
MTSVQILRRGFPLGALTYLLKQTGYSRWLGPNAWVVNTLQGLSETIPNSSGQLGRDLLHRSGVRAVRYSLRRSSLGVGISP